MAGTFLRVPLYTLQVAAAVHQIHEHFFQVQMTSGPSMMPTLNSGGEFVLLDKYHGRLGRCCTVGDMVVAAKPTGPRQYVCKRIIGMPGDVVFADPLVSDHKIKVPKGHVWLAGDNVMHSLDSRIYGPVPMGLIKAKVIARVWPNPGWLPNSLEDYTSS
ncbi:inner membrane peptidase complex catalytic subunit [Schizosaccharomyces octosporus yFS286]|uniref:Inner membrane peptidase complex catalytic subunit n=1 Tax=Schizosaccharomyces octosporus (strain yFS286) TaxID=483514 RepID=S9PTN7_SCHOY|nr:inner membrane peptidase complex catalytic subunit [Schizosaccharomyces octosporus yFS286]EPX72496.1 inner membrane peptidase complex catalytic subunit [Schizosaccharomyces octosporus yFS286]